MIYSDILSDEYVIFLGDPAMQICDLFYDLVLGHII